MNIAITGASGLVGTELTAVLRAEGHSVHPVVRDRRGTGTASIYWSPATGEIDLAAFERIDAVVHLAGENIASGRWNTARKQRILDSRVRGTTLIARSLAGLAKPPATFVCASAIGFYGDRGDQCLDEDATPGRGFLPEVCQAWEQACSSAVDAGIRVVNARIGVVLTAHGGALAQMLTPFRLGVGGVLGSGRQYLSWISLTDVARGLAFCAASARVGGAVNLVAPTPVTNREFTKTLGRLLRRPAVVPVPAFAVRALLGEMGTELLLASTRVVPSRLLDQGFRFSHPTVEEALRAALTS